MTLSLSRLELEGAIKRAAAVRQTASIIIDAAKLDLMAQKMRKTASMDSLFPNLDGLKQLGAGEKKANS